MWQLEIYTSASNLNKKSSTKLFITVVLLPAVMRLVGRRIVPLIMWSSLDSEHDAKLLYSSRLLMICEVRFSVRYNLTSQ